MKRPLYITGGGAVTSGGLNLRQTLAAIRAGLSAFEEQYLPEAFGTPQIMARIPTHYHLRRTPGDWLVSLASRALAEAVSNTNVPAESTAVLIAMPEAFRNHPALDDVPPSQFLPGVTRRTGLAFHSASRLIDGGAAASIALLDRVNDLLEQGVPHVLVGGVDSFLNPKDLARLVAAKRLKGGENAQGFVPGEAAAFVGLTSAPATNGPVVPSIQGVGVSQEADSVLSDRLSQGRGMLAALRAAAARPGPAEPDISFVVSNSNGERFSGLEQMITRARFYQTRREKLATAYPAMTIGETGAAGGALALLLAADSLVRSYAPGPIAMCEVSSEAGMRAAAVVVGARRAA